MARCQRASSLMVHSFHRRQTSLATSKSCETRNEKICSTTHLESTRISFEPRSLLTAERIPIDRRPTGSGWIKSND